LRDKPESEPQEWQSPPVVDYQARIEVGAKIGFLHIQGLLQLDGTAHVDADKIAQWLQDTYYAHKCYVHARWTQLSTKETILDYINKGSTQKTTTTHQKQESSEQPQEQIQPRRRIRRTATNQIVNPLEAQVSSLFMRH
jgi:3-hydroxyacyl-CoA dehydrogenase